MKSPKIYNYLSSFADQDWASFIKFLKWKLDENSVLLILAGFLSENSKALPTLDIVHQELFPTSTRKNVSNKLFLLKGWVEEYFTYTKWDQDKRAKNIAKFESLIEGGFYKEAEKLYHKLRKELIDKSRYSVEAYYYLHRLHHKLYFSFTPWKYESGYSYINNAKHYGNAYVRLMNGIYNHETDYRESVMKYPVDTKRIPLTAFDNQLSEYLNMLMVINQKEDKKAFDSLHKALMAWPKRDTSELFSLMVLSMIYHSRKQLKKKKSKKSQHLLSLYNVALDHGVYNENGFLTRIPFENIIDFGCSTSELVWTKEVLFTYLHKIHPSMREDVREMSLAHIAFYEQEYDASLTYLNGLSLSSVRQNIRAKALKVMSLYELRRYEEVKTSLNSYATYMHTHGREMSEYTTQGVINFISLVRNLLSNKKKATIKEKFMSHENVWKGSWIATKLRNGD